MRLWAILTADIRATRSALLEVSDVLQQKASWFASVFSTCISVHRSPLTGGC